MIFKFIFVEDNKIWIFSTLFLPHAICKGVWLFLFNKLISESFNNNNWVISFVSFNAHDVWRADQPKLFCKFISSLFLKFSIINFVEL